MGWGRLLQMWWDVTELVRMDVGLFQWKNNTSSYSCMSQDLPRPLEITGILWCVPIFTVFVTSIHNHPNLRNVFTEPKLKTLTRSPGLVDSWSRNYSIVFLSNCNQSILMCWSLRSISAQSLLIRAGASLPHGHKGWDNVCLKMKIYWFNSLTIVLLLGIFSGQIQSRLVSICGSNTGAHTVLYVCFSQ
jgi:hypothetical protein